MLYALAAFQIDSHGLLQVWDTGVTLGFSQKGKQTRGVTHPQNQINCS